MHKKWNAVCEKDHEIALLEALSTFLSLFPIVPNKTRKHFDLKINSTKQIRFYLKLIYVEIILDFHFSLHFAVYQKKL